MVNAVTYVGLDIKARDRAVNRSRTLSDWRKILKDYGTKKGMNIDSLLSMHPIPKKGDRVREYVYVRQSLWHILNKTYGFSLVKIADAFNKNHATIINGVKAVDNALDGFNPELREIYDNFIKEI